MASAAAARRDAAAARCAAASALRYAASASVQAVLAEGPCSNAGSGRRRVDEDEGMSGCIMTQSRVESPSTRSRSSRTSTHDPRRTAFTNAGTSKGKYTFAASPSHTSFTVASSTRSDIAPVATEHTYAWCRPVDSSNSYVLSGPIGNETGSSKRFTRYGDVAPQRRRGWWFIVSRGDVLC